MRLVMRWREGKERTVLGQVNLSALIWGAVLSGQLGYQIDARLQGRGLMREALELLMGYHYYCARGPTGELKRPGAREMSPGTCGGR